WDFHLKSTRAMQWSLGIQREVVPSVLVELSYVGTRTIGLVSNVNVNRSFPGPGAQGPRRPLFPVNPNVTNVTYRTNYGSSKYHSLQARVERRYARGLALNFSYTWSKYLANAGNINGGGNGPPQDARCFCFAWGPMPVDRRHLLVLNNVYDFQMGMGRR